MVYVNIFGTPPRRAKAARLERHGSESKLISGPMNNSKRSKNQKRTKDKRGKENIKRLGALDRTELFEPFFFSIPLDLGEVLRKPFMRNQFREFLRKRLAHENLLFFETIEMYQKIDQQVWRIAAGQQMVSKFVANDAPFQVNLSAKVQSRILSSTTFGKETFNAAKRDIFNLMQQNFFDGFVSHLKAEKEMQLRKEKEKREQQAQDGRPEDSPRERSGSNIANSVGLLRRSASRMVRRASSTMALARVGSTSSAKSGRGRTDSFDDEFEFSMDSAK